jgi:hypothetical protein
MKDEKIVQFVSFETTLDSEEFIAKWEQYRRSVNSNLDFTLQQSEKNDKFRYIAQHRSAGGEFKFTFTKAVKSSHTPEVGIKEKQAGGYSILQLERTNDAHKDESKVFVFLTDATTDLDVYRQFSAHTKLNIYEAYYENCQYAYILEFFMKDKFVAELLEQLKQFDAAEIGMFKECTLQVA